MGIVFRDVPEKFPKSTPYINLSYINTLHLNIPYINLLKLINNINKNNAKNTDNDKL